MEALACFREALRSNWLERLQDNEWFLADLREKVVTQLAPEEAFAQLEEVVALLLEQQEPFLRSECAWLLLALARLANTTAMPERLDREWANVMAGLSHDPQTVEQLAAWYRRRGE
jgi:hypothetical protein